MKTATCDKCGENSLVKVVTVEIGTLNYADATGRKVVQSVDLCEKDAAALNEWLVTKPVATKQGQDQ
jgi:hypothetical protein